MEKYIKITISASSTQEAEIIMAELGEQKYYAFEQENNILIAYVYEVDFDEQCLKGILANQAEYSVATIERENWNQLWEEGIKPVIVHDFVAIRPSFYPPVDRVKHDLVITPKMSFGTGHHATTFLMIEMMEEVDWTDKSVVDFGCGTGVLAILAEKCGAARIIAVDYDEWSILNAAENITYNHCKNITLMQQDNVSGIKQVDLVLANINRNVLENEVSSLSSLLKPGAEIIISGFLTKDETELQKVFEDKNLVKKKRRQRGDWLAILFQK